jgi:S-adenosylhomocysteine hydrolase
MKSCAKAINAQAVTEGFRYVTMEDADMKGNIFVTSTRRPARKIQ